MAPYRVAAMIITTMLDFQARKKTRKAAETRRRRIRRLKQQQRLRQFVVKQAISFFLAFLLIVVDQTVFRTVWSKPRSEHWWTLVQRDWDNKEWMEHFQMGQDTFNKLCTELEHYIVKRDTRFRKAIPLQLCVAVTLWKLATNVEYRTLAQLMGIGRSTACEIVNSVCEAITSHRHDSCISTGTRNYG